MKIAFSTSVILCALVGTTVGWAFQAWRGARELPTEVDPDNNVGTALALTRDATLFAHQSSSRLNTLLDEDADPIAKLYAAALSGNTQGDLAHELQGLADVKDYYTRMSALRSLLAAHVERDPETAFTICKSLTIPQMRREALKEIARLWAGKDAEQALTQIDNLREDPAHQDLLAGFVIGLGTLDPESAVEIAIDRGLEGHAYQFRPLFQHYAQTDPIKAISDAIRFQDDRLVKTVIKEWTTTDPTGAFDYLLNLNTGLDARERKRAFEEIGTGFAKYSPDEAAAWIRGLTETDLSDSQRHAIVKKVAETLVVKDPETAFELLTEATAEARDYREVYQTYASSDWESAYESAIALESNDVRGEAILGLLGQLSQRSKVEIEANLENVLEGLPDGTANHFSGDILSKLDDEMVLSLADRYPKLFEYPLRYWAQNIASRDREESIDLISRIEQEEAKDAAVQETVAGWSHSDPAAASALVLTQPEGDIRDRAFKNLVNGWVRTDPESTRTWLASQPVSKSRDQGMREFASLTASTDPQAALTVADQISNEEIRESALGDAFEGLLWQNPETAQEVLADYKVSENLQTRLDTKAEEFAAWKALAQEPAP